MNSGPLGAFVNTFVVRGTEQKPPIKMQSLYKAMFSQGTEGWKCGSYLSIVSHKGAVGTQGGYYGW